MSKALATTSHASLAVPTLVTDQGQKTTKRFLEYFAGQLRNQNTRSAYARAWTKFAQWCDEQNLRLEQVEPLLAAAYIETLSKEASPATVKQHLAALRTLSDWLVIGASLPFNPFSSVRGPRHVVKEGKTPVLFQDDAREFLQSFDTSTLVGLRDKAIVSTMVYSFARISAVVGLKVCDYRNQGRQAILRLREKGGQDRNVPVHHKAAEALDMYLEAAELAERSRSLIFQSFRGKALTGRPLDRRNVWDMVRRRASDVGFDPESVCNHTFRASGITAYLAGGGDLETAAAIAGHASPKTTKLYDRNSKALSQAEIEKIQI